MLSSRNNFNKQQKLNSLNELSPVLFCTHTMQHSEAQSYDPYFPGYCWSSCKRAWPLPIQLDSPTSVWNPYCPKRRPRVLEILVVTCHPLDLNKVASSLKLSVPLLAKLQTRFLAFIQGAHSWELPDPLSRVQSAQAGQAFLRVSCYALHAKCNKLALKMTTFCVC